MGLCQPAIAKGSTVNIVRLAEQNKKTLGKAFLFSFCHCLDAFSASFNSFAIFKTDPL